MNIDEYVSSQLEQLDIREQCKDCAELSDTLEYLEKFLLAALPPEKYDLFVDWSRNYEQFELALSYFYYREGLLHGLAMTRVYPSVKNVGNTQVTETNINLRCIYSKGHRCIYCHG